MVSYVKTVVRSIDNKQTKNPMLENGRLDLGSGEGSRAKVFELFLLIHTQRV